MLKRYERYVRNSGIRMFAGVRGLCAKGPRLFVTATAK